LSPYTTALFSIAKIAALQFKESKSVCQSTLGDEVKTFRIEHVLASRLKPDPASFWQE
jgi:hypothetical protein